ncbi:MAG TPA: glycogen debranching protein GlgX [Pseudonocardiaceae bacterium]|jgi:glycogen operon protein|nr:glycogen debranching protein GlgX [Pseudonocardiaceae bacterium]
MNAPSHVRDRIDSFPTHRIAGYGVRAGRVAPLGASLVPNGVNFAVFSGAATSVSVVLYRAGEPEPMVELPILPDFRIGRVWAITVFGLEYEQIEYGFRVDGPNDDQHRDRFAPDVVLSDPYARILGGREVWGTEPDPHRAYRHRARLAFDDFDWEDDRPPRLPTGDLVVYETHVRGFTRHPSSGVRNPGTYAGLIEKIPYLRRLGVTCVELLPVFEFDEFGNSRIDEATGERLLNYWGYNTVGFFAPKAGYATTGRFGMQGDEFKHMVKSLHAAGIEIMLDVVFNHTAEGNELGPTISFRGLDNSTFYMLTPEGYYYNFSGTGNTVNSNNPVVRDFIVSCLRYWASEYHIDGFRFDLAAIMDRDQEGVPLANPPLIEALAHDPVLRDCKLVAEAWDAGGLYEVGSFPNYHRWSEWNGRYRDTVRRFLKGDEAVVGDLATRLSGSADLYWQRGAGASINFVTCHDGFTLLDLFSYNDKHNEANGEHNNDGANDNNSWNCGAEGSTDDPWINELRLRQVKNALLLLLTSRGIPMLLSGDEVGRTQQGNNNVYCQDNELSWFDWSLAETNADLLEFVTNVVDLRARHPVLRALNHPNSVDPSDCGHPEVSWHGVRPWEPDWSPDSKLLGVMWCGHHVADSGPDYVYVLANAHWETHDVVLPVPDDGWVWCLAADTAAGAYRAGEERPLTDPYSYTIGPRSVVALVARPVSG